MRFTMPSTLNLSLSFLEARARDQHLLAFEEELLVVAVATRRELSFSCSFSALSHSCDYFLPLLVSSEVQANL